MGSVQSCDMSPNDGMALLAVAQLMAVDVLLESGTAGGRSTELMARAFPEKAHGQRQVARKN